MKRLKVKEYADGVHLVPDPAGPWVSFKEAEAELVALRMRVAKAEAWFRHNGKRCIVNPMAADELERILHGL